MDVLSQLASPILVVVMTFVLTYVIKDRARESERLFDAKLETIRAEIGGFRAETGAQIHGLRTETGAQIDGLRAETGAQIDGLRAETGAQIDGLRAEMTSQFDALRAEFATMRADITAIVLAVGREPRRQTP